MSENPPSIIFTPEQIEEQKKYLRSMVRRIAFKHPDLTVGEYAEKYIRIQTGPKMGPFSLTSFPPLEEILFHCGPQSKKQQIFVMASIQTLKTIILDITAQYYTDHYPQDQLFVSATERMGKKWRTRRYEKMLNASGARDRRIIGAFTENQNTASRRSGETMWSIEYEGKTLDIGTAQSAASLSSDTKRILLADEISRWPDDVGKEGHPWSIAHGRVTAFGPLAKSIGVSSPLIDGECEMQRLANTGDMRQYLATCPFCGKRQPLFRGSPESRSGLKWETKAGKLSADLIYYVCDFCNEHIFEHQKMQMLQKVQPRPIRYPERIAEIPTWDPTQTAEADFIISYQIGAIYSAFFSWSSYVYEYNKALKNPEKMQTFVNQRDGLPFRYSGMKPDEEKIITLQGKYQSRQIPHEVIGLTAAVDVQHGQEGWETDDSKERPRLELEIKGHGDGFRMFGIEYRTFEGYLEDIYSGAWQKFREYLEEGGFQIESNGVIYDVKLCLIDARSAKYTDQIYNFCREQGVMRFSPSLGFNTLKRQKDQAAGKSGHDESSGRDYDRFRRKQENDIILYEISTYIFKLALYTRINSSINFIKDKPGENTPAGYIGFPEDYPEHYFDMLLSEEHLPAKHKFQQTKKRNEALDISIYNMAAWEIYLYNTLTVLRAKFSAMKVPAHLIQGITIKFIIRMMKSQKAKGRALTFKEQIQNLKNGKS